MLRESDDLVVLGVTFDTDMTFEKHLRPVSRAASQRHGILRKSWQVFYDRLLLGRCFRGFVMPVLEYCSAVWCSAANTHIKLLEREVSGAIFLTVGVSECDLAHRRSVVVFLCCTRSGVTRCTLFMVLYLSRMCRCVLHAVLCSHISTLMLLLVAEPRSTAGFSFRLSVTLWNDLGDPVFECVGLAVFKTRANAFLSA